jgi:hypothetical protein
MLIKKINVDIYCTTKIKRFSLTNNFFAFNETIFKIYLLLSKHFMHQCMFIQHLLNVTKMAACYLLEN